MMNYHGDFLKSDRKNSRYPYCIVWTPIPILSWVLPFIGHMGICTSSGVIRDFAGSYFVSGSCGTMGVKRLNHVILQHTPCAIFCPKYTGVGVCVYMPTYIHS
uniref:Transmembrane protein 222a n=1 Tax=Seriola lalandi dorsalis TaxID=1841481 RepID=A0A3B4YE63_SERLL